MKRKLLIILPLSIVIFITGCSEGDKNTTSTKNKVEPVQKAPLVTKRWYTFEQAVKGNQLFQTNCASCHKSDASGAENWRKTDANGKLPPPPLNGTAHAWHHPLPIMRRTVYFGGAPVGGSMPGFSDKLSKDDIDSVLAWVQSHWSDEIYNMWYRKNIKTGYTFKRTKSNQ
ncbi:MAG: cytochrome c [Gammaproteobacteria bacterium]|nr:cytochrome c [Gammaproteobacteria bacterium]